MPHRDAAGDDLPHGVRRSRLLGEPGGLRAGRADVAAAHLGSGDAGGRSADRHGPSVNGAAWHGRPATTPSQQVVQRVWRPNVVARQVQQVHYCPEQVTVQVPVQVCRMVTEQQVRQVPVQVCRMVQEEHVRKVPYTTCRQVVERVPRQVAVQVCRMVTEEQVRQVPVTTCRMVEEERVEPYEVRVCKWVCEKHTVQVPRVVTKQVPVTYTYRVPRTVVMRVPVDCGVRGLAARAMSTLIRWLIWSLK